MNKFELRSYQEKGAKDVAKMLASGKQRVLFQLPTGAGKTATFSEITRRYIAKSKKPVLIIVHREELMVQTVKTLRNFCGINAAEIRAGIKVAPVASCFVAMSETANNRLKRNHNFFGNIGLLIVDEAHLGNHFKVFPYFSDSYIVGFSATPLSAKRDKPLNQFFDGIVCGIDIPDLIKSGNLCQNLTYSIKGNFDRSSARVIAGEFAEKEMADEFKKSKSVKNTVSGYEKYLTGKKTVVFNVNVAHSELVNEAFNNAGYPSRHLDAASGIEYRKECLDWLRTTPDAILNNVGILTTGFDEPSVEGIIMNRSTLSMPLWLQIAGRGARTFPDKDHFTIVDMGGNALAHGDWSDKRDWERIFNHPPKKGEGVAPVKDCPECERIIPVSVMLCPGCGFVFKRTVTEEKFDVLEPVFEMVTKGIDVKEIIEKHADKKLYYPFFQIGRRMAIDFRSAYQGRKINDEVVDRLLAEYHTKAKEWCHENGKRFNQWHKEQAKTNLYTHIQKLYPSWQPSN